MYIENFLEEIPLQLKELENGMEKKDFEEIRKVCHKLKSPISFFGLTNLKEKLINVEDFSKMIKNNLLIMGKLYENISTQINNVCQDLKNKYLLNIV